MFSGDIKKYGTFTSTLGRYPLISLTEWQEGEGKLKVGGEAYKLINVDKD